LGEYRGCLGKNWPVVQDVKEVKEVKKNAMNLASFGGGEAE
jgi:hypothetical protein